MKLRSGEGMCCLTGVFAIALTFLHDWYSLSQYLNSAQIGQQKVLSEIVFWYAMASQNAINKIIIMRNN